MSERHVVVGTAGHVDHGKTALVRALTGVDTDRWEEEKRRGITIDLGFAPLSLDNGVRASVVDVPGHEDFVRNMVAGATGVDVALLVVAADEGVMPQTEEHLAILEFLAVPAGVVAVTKTDLVEPEWLELVLEDVREQLEQGTIRWEAPCAVSAVTGDGVDTLRAAIAEAARSVEARREQDLFRMPVDRIFSVAGAGTVVTGTIWSGVIDAGASVRLVPGDREARVRGIEVHGEQRDRAGPGRRTALALAGLPRDAVTRGAQVVQAGSPLRASERVDVRVRLLPGTRPLSQRSRVRVHLGTAEVMARVTPAQGTVTPGGEGTVRLRLEAPLVARWGDRGVLRSWSPVTTIGGFDVLDPVPPARPRRPAGAERMARTSSAADRLRALLDRSGPDGVAEADIVLRAGVETDEVAALIGDGAVVRVGGRLFGATLLDDIRTRLLDALGTFHRERPVAAGIPLDRLRRVARPAALADAAVTALADEGMIRIEDALVRRADHEPAIPAGVEAAADAVRAALSAGGREGADVEELRRAAGSMQEESFRDLLDFLVTYGTARRVGRARYYDAAVLAELVDEVLDALGRDQGSPAQLRDRLGLTRKYLIPLLEWLDAEGYTIRDGDVRRPGPRA